MSDLERAKQHVAAALGKFEQASAAVGAARTEESRLEKELAAALEAERSAAEEGKPASKFTAKVRDLQDSSRLHSYRLGKLRTEAELARVALVDTERNLAHVEVQLARAALAEKADAFESVLGAAERAKSDYLVALGEYRAKRNGAGLAETLDVNGTLEPKNVARVMRWTITTRLLANGELFAGKDYRGVPIESAPDIRQTIGDRA